RFLLKKGTVAKEKIRRVKSGFFVAVPFKIIYSANVIKLFNSNGFCKVTRLVNIITSVNGCMVCKQLHSNRCTKSAEEIVSLRNFDQIIVKTFITGCIFICN